MAIKSDTVDKAFEEIKEGYQTASISMSDYLAGVDAPNLNIEQVVELYARCMRYADEDYLIRGNVEEQWAFLIGGPTDYREEQFELREIAYSMRDL